MAQERIRILLIEDNPGDVGLIRRMLDTPKSRILDLQHASHLGSGLEILKSGAVDVVLLDLDLPGTDRFETVSSVREAAPGVPIIVLTGSEETRTILDSIKAGAKEYFVKSRIDRNKLLEVIRREAARRRAPAIQPKATSSIRVLAVEDNSGDRRLVRRMLESRKKRRFTVIEAANLSDALSALDHPVDLVLLDLNLPDSQDLDTLRRVRARAPSVPIVVLSGMEQREKAVAALENGAKDYLIKGKIDGRLLERAILRHLNLTDAA